MPCSPSSSMLHDQAGGIKEPPHLSQRVGHGCPTDVVWPCEVGVIHTCRVNLILTSPLERIVHEKSVSLCLCLCLCRAYHGFRDMMHLKVDMFPG